jgi:acetyltransferase-like isoleucine patch superfamily enzyme
VIDNQLEFGEVVIDDGCDIGMGAIILPGVHVGKGAIIGAGSVVTKDVEGFTVVAGNPAKLLRKRA